VKEDLNESEHEDENVNNEPIEPSTISEEKDEDEFLEKFQQQQRKREKLETKAKISHRVFCPFYPEVTRRRKKRKKQESFTIFSSSFRSNKNVGGYTPLIGKIIY
jgi:hypothetical protein